MLTCLPRVTLCVDRWEPGTWWDDAACYTREEFICEDSTDLLTSTGLNKPIIFG